MYTVLYLYFIRHKQLPVPGVGTFLLERQPARGDFANRIIEAPVYSISLSQAEVSPPPKLFIWLTEALGISRRDAVTRFNDFSFDLKKNISSGHTIHWNGIGKLSGGLAGEIKFSPGPADMAFEQPVPAEKVIREKSEHTVRVGEEERTSAQMTEILLTQPAVKRSYWWAWALVLGLLCIMFLGWYFSAHGLETVSTGNNQKLVPVEATETYKTP